MAATAEPVIASQWATVADMVVDLGDIPLERIRMVPRPGTASEKDVLEAESRYGRLCELIDGVLVEKTMGRDESLMAMEIGYQLKAFLKSRNLGQTAGPDAPIRLFPGQVRLPDVSFTRWERVPEGEAAHEAISPIVPHLVIEVLSKSNSPGEMERKLREYFKGGVQLVWYIDPRTRTAKAYTAPDQFTDFGEADLMPGDEVLPGFSLSLRDVFAVGERPQP